MIGSTRMILPTPTRRLGDKREKGFSLIELAIVLVVAGVILGGATSLIGSYIEGYRYRETEKKLEKIADALARYAQSYYVVPCPGDPNPVTEPWGAPAGSSTNGDNMTSRCTTVGVLQGIVPFKVLGLTEEDAKDAYGNYITYAVNPSFDYIRQNYTRNWAAVDPDGPMVNCRCAPHYNREWAKRWLRKDGPDTYFPNWMVNKLMFCCPSRLSITTYSDLNLFDEAGDSMFNPQFGVRTPVTSSDDTVLNPTGMCTEGAAPITTELVAFVLVSHGKNGDGAITRSGGQRPVTTVSASTAEQDNRVVSTSFMVGRYSTIQDGRYFDDIVLWRTNYQLMSAFGSESCLVP